MNEKGPVSFPTFEALLEWMAHEQISFPFKGKGEEKWKVIIDKSGLIITSPFYEIKSDPDGYGAPKIFGHLFPLGKEQVSGLVVVGSFGKILNRRRVVASDKLEEKQEIVQVIIVQPDRVIEPVAVIINEPLKDFSSDPNVWIKAIAAARDGVELAAIRTVMAKIFK